MSFDDAYARNLDDNHGCKARSWQKGFIERDSNKIIKIILDFGTLWHIFIHWFAIHMCENLANNTMHIVHLFLCKKLVISGNKHGHHNVAHNNMVEWHGHRAWYVQLADVVDCSTFYLERLEALLVHWGWLMVTQLWYCSISISYVLGQKGRPLMRKRRCFHERGWSEQPVTDLDSGSVEEWSSPREKLNATII